jgi:hypothetical protein
MLTTDGHWFVDEQGRRLLLRGVNLGGDSKMPYTPDGRTHLPSDFSDHRIVSFVGRPFPLADADSHFRRLRHWGFNTLRLLTTWEAIEHRGPGAYDEAYLDYFYEIVKRAGEHGFYLFIDPHQDVWSRLSGGCGAPGWTLEVAGFDTAKLDASEAAITHQKRGADYGMMVWANNSGRLASATMFSLFFGGAQVAPSLKVEGDSIQEYLQRHFINAMCQIAERVKSFPHVLGYDSLNEPKRGYLGIESIHTYRERVRGSTAQVTAFESILVGSGIPVTAQYIQRNGTVLTPTHEVLLNPNGISAWRSEQDDLWQNEGVWEKGNNGEIHLLKDDHFALPGFDFFHDGVRPFARRLATAIRQIHPDSYLFIESEPGMPDNLYWENAREEKIVNASHWYDNLTLFTKRYNPAEALVWGKAGVVARGEAEVQASFAEQLGAIQQETEEMLQGVPTLIGEFGVPFDLNEGTDFQTGQFDDATAALNGYYNALDANLLHSTLWNYTASNENQWGDGWNGEDLSLFSLSQQSDPTHPDSGGRGIAGFCRPTFQAVAGTPLSQHFDMATGDYELRIHSDPGDGVTELYVPRFHYPYGYTVTVSDGMVKPDETTQQLVWSDIAAGEQTLTLRRATKEQ